MLNTRLSFIVIYCNYENKGVCYLLIFYISLYPIKKLRYLKKICILNYFAISLMITSNFFVFTGSIKIY